eukprot:13115834-Alexandrium_andersonii.AAC.1
MQTSEAIDRLRGQAALWAGWPAWAACGPLRSLATPSQARSLAQTREGRRPAPGARAAPPS